jgi:2-iminobutanoate/2-iminopropanoate deaminase
MMNHQHERRVVQAEGAAAPIGPYSQAIGFGPFVFASGSVGIDPSTGDLVRGGIEAETRQALENLGQILGAGGSSLGHAVKTTVFMIDMGEFPRMNAVYGEFFGAMPPARSTVQVAALPKGARVEIEAIASLVAGDDA